MQLDRFYSNKNQGNYYLGLISSVNRKNANLQIENFSLLQSRFISGNAIVPNTIDYYVVIESILGLFIGNVYQTGIKNSDNVHRALDEGKMNEILPDIQLDIVGFKPNYSDSFRMPGFNTVGIGDKVYVANDEIVKIFLSSLHINAEKIYLPSIGKINNLKNVDFSIGPNTLMNRHLMVIGSTGSGKSTSALTILEKMMETQKKIIIIDPTGEYRESFLDTEIQKITLGEDTTISTDKLTLSQWAILFEANSNSQPAVLADAIVSLRYQNQIGKKNTFVKDGRSVSSVHGYLSQVKTDSFDLSLLSEQVKEESVKINSKDNFYLDNFVFNSNRFLVQKIDYKLQNTSLSHFFNDTGKNDLIVSLEDFLNNDTCLYIDSSKIGTTDGVGGMIVDLIANYLLNKANKAKPFIFFLDEAHRYTKNMISSDHEFYTGLISIAREGRKNGQYLLLTTQSPADVSKVLLGQMGSLLIHRLTHQDELNTISNFVDVSLLHKIKKLGQGEAILSSVNLLQNIILKMNKSKREHFNDSPEL